MNAYSDAQSLLDKRRDDARRIADAVAVLKKHMAEYGKWAVDDDPELPGGFERQLDRYQNVAEDLANTASVNLGMAAEGAPTLRELLKPF